MYPVRVIRDSVGQGGRNNQDDVGVVQALLNRALDREPKLAGAGVAKLAVDKKCGSLTVGAIEKFQSAVLGWSGRAVDGRVDPNGKTWKALNRNVASPAKIRRLDTTPATYPAVGPYRAFRQGDYKAYLGDRTSGTIARYGCAMCTLTMAATYIGSPTRYWPEKLDPKDLSPPAANEILLKAGAFREYALNQPKAALAMGMNYDEYGRWENLASSDLLFIHEHLRRQLPVAAHVDYKRDAAGDHWILITARFAATGSSARSTRPTGASCTLRTGTRRP